MYLDKFNGDLVCEIESLYNKIITALELAAVQSVPRKKGNYYKQWWDQELKDAKDRSMVAHSEWVSNGKKREGYFFEHMKKYKYEYKLLIKSKEQDSNKKISDDLSEALTQKGQTEFWKTWNSKLGSNKKCSQIISGTSDEHLIASNFAAYFEDVNSVFTIKKEDSFKASFNERLNSYKGSECGSYITASEIGNIANCLKSGKAAGSDGMVVEHIKYSHPILMQYLTILFNLCIAASYIPKSFTKGIIIPILKGANVDASKMENYRGITLCNVFSKLFESCLMHLYSDFLLSDELQFGFKKNTGWSDAIATASSVIKHYVDRGSTVTACLLDLSKPLTKSATTVYS
jgi:phage terminase large subunit-like protein